MTTEIQERTDVTVPKATWRVLEREVLSPANPKHPAGYSLVMKGVRVRKRSVALRYDLSDPDGRAGAVWLVTRLKTLDLEIPYGHPEPIYRKRDVLQRVVRELKQALRESAP